METKTEPVLTKDLIDKATHAGFSGAHVVIGALTAVAMAEPAHEASMRTAAAQILTRHIERNQ